MYRICEKAREPQQSGNVTLKQSLWASLSPCIFISKAERSIPPEQAGDAD
jgi:hypothetical protein